MPRRTTTRPALAERRFRALRRVSGLACALTLGLVLVAPAARAQLDCTAAPALACNQWSDGTTRGGLDSVGAWPCAAGTFDGSEAVHSLVLDAPSQVSVLLDELGEEGLDVLVLDACDPSACLGWGDARVDLALEAGSYLVVVDGRDGVESEYRLGVACGEALEPSLLEVSAAPGECFDEEKLGWLAAPHVRADVLFAIDLTFSMDQERAQLQTVMQDVVDRLRGLVPDVAFGLVSYRDYFTSGGGFDPCNYNAGGYGNVGDWPYRLEQSITADRAAIQAAVDGLAPAGGGGDGPEAAGRMMLEAAEDPAIGWRDGARRLLVSLSDAIPHDCEVGACLGRTTTPLGPDLGRDGQPATGDEFGVLEAVDALVREDVTLLHLDTSGGGVFFGASLRDLWNCWAEQTGGEAVALNADGTVPDGIDLAELVARLVRSRLGGCDSLELVAEPGFEDWLVVSEPVHRDVAPGGAFGFSLTFCVPEGTAEGLHEFEVLMTCDGAVLASQRVRVEVALPCEPPTLGPAEARDAARCNRGVEITWPAADFPSGAGVYHVHRSPISCEDALMREPIATSLPTTRFVDTDAEPGVAYFHVVEAEDSNGETSCTPVGRAFGGAVARSCVGPTIDVADPGGVPDGVYAELFLSHEGQEVRLAWPGARALLPGESFHLLQAHDDPRNAFSHLGPDDGDAREVVDLDTSSPFQLFDLRVADPCGSISIDEFPPTFSP